MTKAEGMFCAVRPILRDDDARNGPWQLDDFKQKQDENDGQDERKPTSAVVAETRSHTIATKAEHQNQNNQKDKHLCFSPFGEISPAGGVMQIWCMSART
jgi:hypothetical protein